MKISKFFEKFKNSERFASLLPSSKTAYSGYLEKLVNLSGDCELFSELANNQPLDVENEDGQTLTLNSPEEKISFEKSLWFNKLAKIESMSTRLMAHRILTTAFAWGRDSGLLLPGSYANMRSPKANPVDQKPFTKEEMEMIYALTLEPNTPSSFNPYLRAGYFAFLSGMRPSEVESLHWANISPSGFVEIFSAKHRERGKLSRLCRITDGIRGCLEREVTSRLEGSDLIFKSITGSPLNKDMRARAMKYACEALGIEPRPFYSTRRGTATEMFKAGYDVAKIAGQLGHKDIKTTMIYIRPSMKETAEAFRGF